MLLTVDIGNTNITMALIHEDDHIAGTFRVTTKAQRTSDEYGMTLMEFCRNTKVNVEDIKDVIISSVVPKVMHSFNNSIRKYIKKEPIIVGPGIKTGISIKTDFPKEVGADKIVDAAAVY
ncbi:MAG: type III pantothenate kinase, partial [Firmicutes bacterium]|nr:type III pantothenate kinase [Bacillota bacterium]